MTWLQSAVRRWGWRTVGVVVTSFGIYVVIPSLITLLGAWPDLGQVRPWWFAVLFVLELASFAATWALLRVALPHTSWTAVATSQVVGNAASKVLPGERQRAESSRARSSSRQGNPEPSSRRPSPPPA